MFKIAPPKSDLPPAVPPSMPEATDVEPVEKSSGPDLGVDAMAKVDQQKANYLGPKDGPFECGNCSFWQDPSECQIVSGTIDPKGVCQLFTPLSGGSDQESPVEDAPEKGQIDVGAL